MDVIFRTPGANLLGSEKDTFDEIKNIVDQATNDFLIRPDWNLNLRAVELIKPLRSATMLGEVTLLLRKKIRSSTPVVAMLTIRLMESLITNCGPVWHGAMNDPKVTSDIAAAARKFSGKTGAENTSVSEAILDVVQGWGEAFLPRQKQFPHIVNLYFTLRKEGLPFKVHNQFDPNRVPIFVDSSGRKEAFADSTDAILAASLQSTLEIERQTERFNSRMTGAGASTSSSSRRDSNPPPRGSISQPPPSMSRSSSSKKAKETIESLSASVTLLTDVILAATSVHEVKSNDIAIEIVQQLKTMQPTVATAIEENMDNAEILSDLFQWNDKSQTIVTVFTDMKEGKLTLLDVQKLLHSTTATTSSNSNSSSSVGENKKAGAVPHTLNALTSDLIDYGAVIVEAEVRSRQNSRAEPFKPPTQSPQQPQQLPQQPQPLLNDFADFANFAAFPTPTSTTGMPPRTTPVSLPTSTTNTITTSAATTATTVSSSGSKARRSSKASESLIQLDDPFSDAALDAMLNTPPKRDSAPSSSTTTTTTTTGAAMNPLPLDFFAAYPAPTPTALPPNYPGYPPVGYGIAAHAPPPTTAGAYPPIMYGGGGVPPYPYAVPYPGYAPHPTAAGTRYPPTNMPNMSNMSNMPHMSYGAGGPSTGHPGSYPPVGNPYHVPSQPQPQPAAATNTSSATNNNNAVNNPFDIFE